MNATQRPLEDGFALIAILAILVPLFVMVASSSTLMTGRTSRVSADLDDYRALQAAEAGVDEGVYRARNGTLVAGGAYTVDLSNDCSFTGTPTALDADGVDNDGDGAIDEADEQVIELVVRGEYRDRTRRVVVFIQERLPGAQGAIVVHDGSITVSVTSDALVTGQNTEIDGDRGSVALDVHGFAIAPPGVLADLDAQITGSEESRVQGLGGWPSKTETAVVDVDTIIDWYRTNADRTLGSSTYWNDTFGTTGSPESTFRDGNLRLSDGSGAGILVVSGDLELDNDARYNGLVVVGGTLVVDESSRVTGAIVQGPRGKSVLIDGPNDSDDADTKVRFSDEALDLADSVWTGPLMLRGWQEIARD